MNMTKKLLLALCLSWTALAAHGDVVYWIGRPSTADYIRFGVTKAIVSAGEYRKNIARFDAELDKARTNYFTASLWSKSKAADELGLLLYGKDVFLASLIIPNGYGEHTTAVNRLLGMLSNNRQVDGGIRGPAEASFQDWVMSMRRALGAKGENDILFVTGPAFEKALLATADSYAKYRQDRDVAELRAWKSAHPERDEVAGSRKLNKSTTVDLLDKNLGDRFADTAYNRALRVAQNGGAQRLMCHYGPSFDASGFEVFAELGFWKSKPPANMPLLRALGESYPRPYTDHAVSSCPGTEAEAVALLREPQRALITPEARETAKAERAKDQQMADEKAQQAKKLADAYREIDERRSLEARQANDANRAKRIEASRASVVDRELKAAEANAAVRAQTAVSREERKKRNDQCKASYNEKLRSGDRQVMAAGRTEYSSCLRGS